MIVLPNGWRVPKSKKLRGKSASDNDKLLRVMRSLNESFPEENYSDIESAAKKVLAALDGDA